MTAAEGDPAVRIWDAATGEPAGSVVHPKPAWFADFPRPIDVGPDVDRAASGGNLLTGAGARLYVRDRWDAAPRPRPTDVRVGSRPAVSPDGTLALVLGGEAAQVVDLRTGELVCETHSVVERVGHAPALGPLARFSRNGRRFATTGGDVARVWDARTGDPLSPALRDHAGGTVRGAVFDRDGGRLLTFGSAGRFTRSYGTGLWDLTTGRLAVDMGVDVPAGIGARAADVSPDGRLAAVAWRPERWDGPPPDDGDTALWAIDGPMPDAAAANNAAAAPRGLVGAAGAAAAFSSDGSALLTAGGNLARIWRVGDRSPLTPSMAHSGPVSFAAFVPGDRWVLTGSADGLGRVWDARTGAELARTEHHGGPVVAGAASADGRLVATSGEGRRRTVRIWDPANGREASTIDLGEGGGPATELAFSPDGRSLLIVTDPGFPGGSAGVWDVATGRQRIGPLYQDRIAAPRAAAAFSPDGRLLAVAGVSEAGVWDVATGTRQAVVPNPAGDRGVLRSVAFDPAGQSLLLAGTEGLWAADPRSGRATAVEQPPEGNGATIQARFDRSGVRLIVVGSRGVTVRDRTNARDEVRAKPRDLFSAPMVGDVSPDARHFAAGDDAADRTSLIELPAPRDK